MTDDATPFALVVRFTVRPEAEVSFDDLTARTTHLIRDREPGTLVYATHRVPDSPRVRVFYELYRNRAAFDTHEEQTYVRAFLAEREAMLEATEVTFMDLMDGKTPVVLPQ
jgi:quinol monooxygenase YgiN